MKSHFYIAPPGAGKTTFQKKHPGIFIDPEGSIDWKRMDEIHGLYNKNSKRCLGASILEHELDWPTVWIEELLPRLRAAILLEKDVLMGMITPSSVEIASKIFQEFRENTTVVLPDEDNHFKRVWGHEEKRMRTWGPELRGWQHTFWIRLLMQGFAKNLGIKTADDFIFSKKSSSRKPNLAAREALDDKQRRYIEIFISRWAALNESDEVVAMYKQISSDANGISLKCDQTSKICGKGKHDCSEIVLLKNDVDGNDLSTWIARDKIKSGKKKNAKNALVFFVGTLAPFHRGHLEMLNSAKSYLEKGGWNVLGGYASVFSDLREGRADSLHSILGPAEHRSNLLELGLMGSDWLSADFPTDHVLRLPLLEKGIHPMQMLAKRLRVCGALGANDPVTTFWVNGKDGVMKQDFFGKFAEFADADKNNPLRMLIVDNRPGNDEWSEEQLSVSVPSLLPYLSRRILSPNNPTSATRVRAALMSSDRSELASAVGLPLVEAYLMGLMNKMTVHA